MEYEEIDNGIEPHAFTHGFLVGKLIKAASKQFKALPVAYGDLKEHEKRKILDELHEDVDNAVRHAIDVIAGNARLVFRASVDQVVFKDGVKAVLSMGKTESAHALADATSVIVVIEDRESMLMTGDSLDVDSDQKSLEM